MNSNCQYKSCNSLMSLAFLNELYLSRQASSNSPMNLFDSSPIHEIKMIGNNEEPHRIFNIKPLEIQNNEEINVTCTIPQSTANVFFHNNNAASTPKLNITPSLFLKLQSTNQNLREEKVAPRQDENFCQGFSFDIIFPQKNLSKHSPF